jgi:hypothetical protein
MGGGMNQVWGSQHRIAIGILPIKWSLSEPVRSEGPMENQHRRRIFVKPAWIWPHGFFVFLLKTSSFMNFSHGTHFALTHTQIP